MDAKVASDYHETMNSRPSDPAHQKHSTYAVELSKGLTESSKESDSEEEEVSPRPQHITEKRRVQNAIFSSWYGILRRSYQSLLISHRISKRAEKVTKEERKKEVENADDEALSIRLLMSKQESNVIITGPREYQVELFERAKKQNTIAVLDTGSGKTLIAVLLLKHIMDQELEDRAHGKRRRISFFLVWLAYCRVITMC